MTFILRSTRLLYNVVGFIRPTCVSKKFIFVERQKIFKLNELVVRSVALSTQKEEDKLLDSVEKFEKGIYQLSTDINRKRVFKENFLKILDNLKQNGEIKSYHMLILLKCCTDVCFMCSEEERIQMAKDVWSCGEELGVKFDESHYNALLTVFLKNNHQFSCNEFLNKMEKEGVEPNVVTYKSLLRAFCQQGDIEGARNLLDKMQNLNYSINLVDFNSLILGYSKIGDFEKAQEILKIMKERDINPSSESYALLLCGYIENENLEKFEEMFNELYDKMNIKLSDFCLMKIIYSLALKQKDSHVDMVMQKLTKSLAYERLVTNFIQRLLHKKLDSTALKLLETIKTTDRMFNYNIYISRYVFDHFIHYRKPKEIFNICQDLEEKGLVKAAIAYCLKKIFLVKNENFIIDFINEMKTRGLPVREHYYWPPLIQASKKGNKNLLSFLSHAPMEKFVIFDSFYRIVLPNYKFSATWEADIEKLSKSGINCQFTTRYFFEKFLKESPIEEVERLVATYPVHYFSVIHAFKDLFSRLSREPEKVEQVVNILYNFYHDAYLAKNIDPNLHHSSYFDNAIASLLKKVQDEKIILRVLEAMLEKKMGISSNAGSKIVNSFPNLDDLVSKLSDPNLKIELNETLLKAKNLNAEIHIQDEEVSLKNCVRKMLNLAMSKNFNEALKYGEKFLLQKNENDAGNLEEIKSLYRNFFFKIINTKDEVLLEKSFELGTKLGIWDSKAKRDGGLLISGLLKCNNVSKALEKFKEVLQVTGNPVLCPKVFTKCISEGKAEEVEEIMTLLSEMGYKNLAFSSLIFALATLGKVDKAKKILNSTEFTFQSNLVLNNLSAWYDEKNSDVLENFVEVFKDLKNFDYKLTPLYKALIKIYAENNEIDKIKNLWLEIKEKNIKDKNFLEQLSQFEQDLNITRLSKSIIIDFERAGVKQNEKDLGHNFRDKNRRELDEKYLNAMMDHSNIGEAVQLAKKLAFQGDVDKACSLIDNYSIRNIQAIANAFLMFNNFNEYFKFLDFFASKENFIALSKCFKVNLFNRLMPVLEMNDEYFKKYKFLSLLCADKTNLSRPVISCFVTCAKLNGKLKDAEEIIVQYSNYFENLSFSELVEIVEVTELAPNFYKNVLSSKILKDFFADHLHEFYNKLINVNCEQNKLDEALNYLDEALANKVEKLLDKNLIMLKEKLKSQGKTHPYLEGIN